MKLDRRVDIIEQQLNLNKRLKGTELEAVVDLDETGQTFTQYFTVIDGEREEITGNQKLVDELMDADDSISVEVRDY